MAKKVNDKMVVVFIYFSRGSRVAEGMEIEKWEIGFETSLNYSKSIDLTAESSASSKPTVVNTDLLRPNIEAFSMK